MIAADLLCVEIEQPCPNCKRVHYSIYTMERCAVRHQILSEWTDYAYAEEKKGKRQKQVPPQTGAVRREAWVG
jgi:hypothetical protein